MKIVATRLLIVAAFAAVALLPGCKKAQDAAVEAAIERACRRVPGANRR